MYIWQITFSYETPGGYASNIERSVYNVIAETEENALSKAYNDFSHTECFTDLNLAIEGRVKSKVKKIRSKKINFPKLTLQNDQETYEISAKLSEDGSSLEYIVYEKG